MAGKDPRWLESRYPGKCAKCGQTIKRGASILYFPIGKTVLCDREECGQQAYRDFRASVADEGFQSGNYSTLKATIDTMAACVTPEAIAALNKPTAHTPAQAGLPQWADLLKEAVNEPGTLSAAYSAFWDYSFGNQLLAMSQCHSRGIPAGPIATYEGWKIRGRQVQKGQKAIILCQPVTFAKSADPADPDADTTVRTVFIYRPRWFVASQTDSADGKEAETPAIPGWDRDKALVDLDIALVPYDLLSGNVQGYATGRKIALNPLAQHGQSTLLHEVAHIVLGHCDGSQPDRAGRDVREMQAEAVAYILGSVLGFGNAAESRGYIQNWYGQGRPVSDTDSRAVLKAADAILRAGRPQKAQAATV